MASRGNIGVLLALLVAMHCCAQVAPDISGDWQGRQESWQAETSDLLAGQSQGSDLLVWLKVEKAGSGGWKAILSENADPRDLHPQTTPVTSITLSGSRLNFTVDPLHLQFTGNVNPGGNAIEGNWRWGGGWHAVELRRVFEPQPVTVQELEELVNRDRAKPDAAVAKQLYGMKMTERLSGSRLLQDEGRIQGAKTKEALQVLEDYSTFLEPPVADIPDRPPPDAADQQRMIALTVDFVREKFQRLPDFFASRTTTTFERNLWTEKALHKVGQSSVTIRYGSGEEHREKAPGIGFGESGLVTSGEFGPILGTVMLDAAESGLVWSRWEQGPSGIEAVFSYTVTEKASHYEVEGERTAYHGEIAVNPVTGEVQRVVLKADTDSNNPLMVAEIAVQYGAVEIGGESYICPVKSVAVSQLFAVLWLHEVVFDHYHLFRSSSRILTGNEDQR